MYIELSDDVCCNIVTAKKHIGMYNKTFVVNLIRTTQTISLQRDNYNIKMCLNSSEISTIFSSANIVSSMNLILYILGCFLYGER